ncbi:hypothetical protein E2C01_090256 [Portunus trituberculatus]|uniref:Uncharacterized protein n=1 Tax=Portunus trituberculatus TaxID=210409 RepID=A0A5B7JAZ4_PORTR|nr:hypothetical protein [Portunus trituberculatus]
MMHSSVHFDTAHQSCVEVLLFPVGGILTNKATFEEGPREKTHVRHPSADLLSSYDLSRLKSKLGFDQESGKSGSEEDQASSNTATCNGSSPAIEEPVSKESVMTSDPSATLATGIADTDLDTGVKGDEGAKEKEVDTLAAAPSKPSGTVDPGFSSLPPSLAASMDPQQFKLEPPVLGKPNKITKENFENVSSGGLKKTDDPSDPFSGLDPLWSHKKSS